MNRFLSSKDAAKYLGYSHRTLANSRHLGLLGGAIAPPYKKVGITIRYEISKLDEWLAQFEELVETRKGA